MADAPAGYRVRQAPVHVPQGPPEGYRVRTGQKYIGSDVAAGIGDLTEGGTTMPMSTVVSQAIENAPESAVQFGKDIIQPIIHPIDTAKALGNVILGGVQKLVPGQQDSEKYADAVGNFFAERYGGLENVKNTMAKDPVGFAADVATVLTGGGTAAARAPGMAGTVARAAQTAGRAVDPVNAAVQAAKLPAKLTGKATAAALGVTTGAGGKSIGTAARAGLAGGEAGKAFRENLRGDVPVDEVVTEARSAAGAMRRERGKAYRGDMAKLAKDTTVLDFAPIDKALRDVSAVGTFKGKVINRSTEGTWKQVSDLVDEWRQSDAAEFHTPEGLDALKKAIGDVRDSTQYGTPSRVIADKAYNAVKDQIVKQAPEYAKTMKNYEKASVLIREIEGTLSLNPTARVDTALRKLQSVMRNNANTNYGKRLDLAEMLQEAGASHLMEKLAGQMLRSAEPRSLARFTAGPTALASGAGAYLANPLLAVPAFAGAAAVSSPRLMGEAAHLAGRAVRPIVKAPPGTGLAAYQAGRAAGADDDPMAVLSRLLAAGGQP